MLTVLEFCGKIKAVNIGEVKFWYTTDTEKGLGEKPTDTE